MDENINPDLADELNERLKEAVSTNAELLKGTRIYNTLLDQIADNNLTINNYIENDVEFTSSLIDKNEKLLELVDKRVIATQERNDLTKKHLDNLKDSVGLNNEVFELIKKGAFAALGFMVLAKVVGFLKDMVTNTIKMQKEMGVGVKNVMAFEANIVLAKASVNGLLFSMDELREASLAVTEVTGNILVPPETISEVAELNALLGDTSTAVSLQRTLENAGVDAGVLTDNIKEMASSMGVDAGSAMEYLASNQLELGGLTEQQILKRAEEGLMLKKMGADMKELNRLASESLDIETSLRNEMKLRMMTGKEINLNELRAAQASGDVVALGKAQANLVAQLGDDLHNNLQVQRMISDATGMSTEQLLNYDNASKENAKTQDELLAIKEKYGLADIDQAKELKSQLVMDEARLALITKYSVILGGVIGGYYIIKGLMSFFGKGATAQKGNPISNFIKSMGSKQVLMGAAAMLIISASLMVTAKALNEFNTVEWESLGMAGLALLGLVGSVAALGAVMMSGIGAVAILAGAAALLTIAGSMVVLGAGIQLIGNNIGSLENLVPMLSSLVLLSPGLLALSGSLTILSGSLLGLSVGLAAVSVFLPVLGALSNIGLIGGGGETQETDNGMGELLDEVKGLRRDIQTQPIMINVDGKVVSAISKVQSRQMSVNTTGYGR